MCVMKGTQEYSNQAHKICHHVIYMLYCEIKLMST